MLVIAPGAALLVFVGLLLVGGTDTHVPADIDRVFLAVAVTGLAATLGAIAGLTAGSRVVTGVAVLVQAAAASLLLGLWYMTPDFRIGEDDTELVFGLIGVLLADLLAASAIVMPARTGRTAARSAFVMGSSWQRSAALIAMSGVGLVSFALLMNSALGRVPGVRLDYAITSAMGVAGAGACVYALGRRLRSLAAGAAVAQAVLAGLLLVWLAAVSSYLPVMLLVVLAADALTIWAAFLSRHV